MINLAKSLGISTLVLGGAMGATALAQTPATNQSAPPAAQSSSSMNPNDATTYATGKPLENQSSEGFWGHMNPFARKKWVKREVDPIRDRENELDQLQAKNANNIKDVDSRAQAGINNAMMAANNADQHAADAASRANAAQTTATTATSRTDALNGTVSKLDQYEPVTSTDVRFAAGRTALGPQGKTTLDDMAAKLAGDKGYIVEIQAYSRSGDTNLAGDGRHRGSLPGDGTPGAALPDLPHWPGQSAQARRGNRRSDDFRGSNLCYGFDWNN
jgi:hypothetical protein